MWSRKILLSLGVAASRKQYPPASKWRKMALALARRSPPNDRPLAFAPPGLRKWWAAIASSPSANNPIEAGSGTGGVELKG